MSRLSMILLDEEALDLEVTEEVAPEEVAESAIEVIDANDESVACNSDATELLEVTETLEGLRVSAQLLHTEGFSKSAVAMLAVGLDSIERRTGGAYAIKSVVNYSSESDARDEYGIMMESIGEHIKKALESFISLLKRVAISLSTFFLKLFNSAPKIESRANDLIRELDSINNSVPSDKIKCNAKWLTNGHEFSPADAVIESKKTYDVLVKVIERDHKEYTELFKELMKLDGEKYSEYDAIRDKIDQAVDFDKRNTELSNSILACHRFKYINGVYTLIPVSDVAVNNKQKCLNKRDAKYLLTQVINTVRCISGKKDFVKDINKAIDEELSIIKKMVVRHDKESDHWLNFTREYSKISVKKQANSLNNAANFSFRVAIAGLQFGESCVKKLVIENEKNAQIIQND